MNAAEMVGSPSSGYDAAPCPSCEATHQKKSSSRTHTPNNPRLTALFLLGKPAMPHERPTGLHIQHLPYSSANTTTNGVKAATTARCSCGDALLMKHTSSISPSDSTLSTPTERPSRSNRTSAPVHITACS